MTFEQNQKELWLTRLTRGKSTPDRTARTKEVSGVGYGGSLAISDLMFAVLAMLE